MVKAEIIEKKWATTLKFLYATDVIFVGIIVYFIVCRVNGNRDVPTYLTISLVAIGVFLGNIILFLFMRVIKDVVKGIVK